MRSLVNTTKTRQKSGVKSYASGAMWLALAGMAAKILGAVYRIPLTNLLGAEGIGVYQLVFPIYALMLTLSSGGVPTAISRIISEKRAVGDDVGIQGIKKAAIILLVALGALSSAVLLAVAAPLAGLQGNAQVRYEYMVVAPAILIVCISAYFKGCYQGEMNMVPTAIAQIAEQVFKMIFGLLLTYLLLPRGVLYAVTGALFAIVLSEFASMLILATMYIRGRQKHSYKVLFNAQSAKEIVTISLPIMASGLVFPMVQFVDSLLIVNLLVARGLARDVAVGQYGILTAPVNSLINMPIVVTLAFAVAIVPIISSKRAMRDAPSIKEKSCLAVKLSFLIGAPCFVAIFVLAKPLMQILYPALDAQSLDLAAALLMVSSVSVILLSLSQVFTSLLQGLGKTVRPVLILLATAVTKISLDIVLIMHMGIIGGALSSVIAYTLCVAIGWATMSKLLGSGKNLVKNISKIMIISVIMGLIIFGLSFALAKWWLVLAAVAISVPLYFVAILLARVFDKRELVSFPFGAQLAKLSDKLTRTK